MLVLSRRLNEKLLIPCIRTTIQVLSIQGGQVRLGVDAPAEVAVFREEIYQGAGAPAAGRDPAVQLDLVRSALRNRLSGLALGLNRVQRQVQGKLAPAARAELDKLADEFGDLARIMKMMLEEDDAPPTKQKVGCSR